MHHHVLPQLLEEAGAVVAGEGRGVGATVGVLEAMQAEGGEAVRVQGQKSPRRPRAQSGSIARVGAAVAALPRLTLRAAHTPACHGVATPPPPPASSGARGQSANPRIHLFWTPACCIALSRSRFRRLCCGAPCMSGVPGIEATSEREGGREGGREREKERLY